MPLGKIRSKQRSSSNSSYASTVTTIVFIALCILGAWMLTSNSFFSPETNTRIVTSTRLPNALKTDTTPAFEDNPGDLPDDAIKLDQKYENKQDVESEKGDVYKQEDGGVNDVNRLSADLMDPAKVSGIVVKDKSAIVEENPVGLRGEMSLEEQEKQKELETQTSEESTMTIQSDQEVAIERKIELAHENVDKLDIGKENVGQESKAKEEKKEVDKINVNKPDIGKEDVGKESKAIEEKKIQPDIVKEDVGKESKAKEEKKIQPDIRKEEVGKPIKVKEGKKEIAKIEAKPHEITEEEQEHRMEQHRRQEEENSQGTTSGDQIEHDESQIDEKKEGVKPIMGNQGEVVQSEKGNVNLNKETKQMKDDSLSTSGIPKESKESKKSWSTQAHQSENQKDRRYMWQLCNLTAGADYIPCLDNEKAIKKLPSRGHYEHRERHCPEEPPTCLVPIPEGYKKPVEWPHSRNKIWYHNVPHTLLAEVKGHQNWVKVTGEFLTFPGGGTQFIHGALHYIDFIQEAVPEIAWGKHTRVVLDVGCGVASFGGYLFERDVVTMSFAPKDEHEAQVQFALERGIPAISAVMGTQRLPFPSRVFDLVHCARCRVPWHVEGGALLLELNRVLRPGGYFVWSATPVYQKLEEDVQIWKEMTALTISMCWELVTIKKDKLNSIGAAIYQKPESNECYDARKQKSPPICKPDDDPNAAWYVPLQSCIHRLPINERERGSQWPEEWPHRLEMPPYWLNKTQNGIYGKPAPEDFAADYQHWKHVVKKSYLNGLGIKWSDVRNVMDMRAVYGGFAAAMREHNVWVMNVVNVDSPDTLPIIYERGLFGIYHDWCESFSTYPRTYDLLHADHLFFKLKTRCKLVPVMAEIDRIVRPGGRLIVRDETGIIGEVENILKSLRWEVHLTLLKNHEGILSAQKSNWRPDTYAPPS